MDQAMASNLHILFSSGNSSPDCFIFDPASAKVPGKAEDDIPSYVGNQDGFLTSGLICSNLLIKKINKQKKKQLGNG